MVTRKGWAGTRVHSRPGLFASLSAPCRWGLIKPSPLRATENTSTLQESKSGVCLAASFVLLKSASGVCLRATSPLPGMDAG